MRCWSAEKEGIRERFHGAFRRAITLPSDTDDEQITAEFFNGLVEITVRGGVTGGAPRRIALRGMSTDTETRSLG
jgi:HSP20 family protein